MRIPIEFINEMIKSAAILCKSLRYFQFVLCKEKRIYVVHWISFPKKIYRWKRKLSRFLEFRSSNIFYYLLIQSERHDSFFSSNETIEEFHDKSSQLCLGKKVLIDTEESQNIYYYFQNNDYLFVKYIKIYEFDDSPYEFDIEYDTSILSINNRLLNLDVYKTKLNDIDDHISEIIFRSDTVFINSRFHVIYYTEI
jgi:hypothetical protein